MKPRPEEDFRRKAKRKIAQIVELHGEQPEFDVVLAIGKCCTAITRREHAIWDEEARAAMAGHAQVAARERRP